MSDSDKGTNARKSYRPRKGKDQAEREELSLTRSLREGTASAPAAPGCQERRKPHPKEKAPSLKGNLQTGDKVGHVNLEADLRLGVHKGERAQAAAGRKAEQPTEAPTPAGKKEGRVRKTTPDR